MPTLSRRSGSRRCFPEPTPYRAPLLDRVAAHPEIDLTVVYAAGTVAGRTWRVEPKHRAVFLRGLRVPGAQRILHHDYPVTPGVVGVLTETRPSVVVVSGWSTFAAQAAIAWCGIKDVPYVLVVESHDEGPRAGWRRTVKGTVVPPVVQRSAGVLVTGTLARDSMIARGAAPERVHLFANTVDVEDFGAHADRLAGRRPELRAELGASADDVVVLSRRSARAGEGARRARAERRGRGRSAACCSSWPATGPSGRGSSGSRGELGVTARARSETSTGSGSSSCTSQRTSSRFSRSASHGQSSSTRRRPAGCRSSSRTASGLRTTSSATGRTARSFRPETSGAAATALRELAADPELRRAQGARSRELARDWGYGPSVEGFLDAVREAVADRKLA